MKRTKRALLVVFLLLALIAYLFESYLLNKIYVSAEDEFGFITPQNYLVTGPEGRLYDCDDSEKKLGCKHFNEYEIKDPHDSQKGYLIMQVYKDDLNSFKDSMVVGNNYYMFNVSGDFEGINQIKNSLYQLEDIDTGDCRFSYCGPGCTDTKAQFTCGKIDQETREFYDSHHCVDKGGSCKAVSNDVLKREYLMNNYTKIFPYLISF